MLKETNTSNEAEGADMFFPSIIYILLKGCPKDLKAHLDFIKLYRNPELLESEDDYFLTTMSSAIDFVGNMIGDDLNIEKSEYKDLYDKFSEEKGGEIDQRAHIRKEKKLDKNYDEFENQSEVSCITTQSSAQILGELEKMDVPIISNTLKLNKGIQTEVLKEEIKEVKESTNKSLVSASTASETPASSLWFSKFENKVITENEQFWSKTLTDDFESLKISDLKEMHKIML
mmetsp:Transcript_39884/g.39468  ORF Transcript_39884/g.39468 Transcript_39884/m.39468 type:complete len:231 (-) Transcript_39884:74-766(-)